jgi:hypothetical protein
MRPHLLTQSTDWWIKPAGGNNKKEISKPKAFLYTATNKEGQNITAASAAELAAAIKFTKKDVFNSLYSGLPNKGYTITRKQVEEK